jgi:hypothetical protein
MAIRVGVGFANASACRLLKAKIEVVKRVHRTYFDNVDKIGIFRFGNQSVRIFVS